ncbi:hypothetical protein FZEAL_1912 [Fusarium zealandicum]|uniref:Uncharacterized protein n=1 Tax=Fusarium zealandicum TaxID=1053134 RepID=A0A8H4XNX6_9HYPO|nr:hypothetical protein FZEAL_1912 [Fusarium zealandicum]
MFTFGHRTFRPLLALIWTWATGAWSLISHLLNRGTRAPYDAEKRESPETPTLQSTLPASRHDNTSIYHSASIQDHSQATPTTQHPPRIRYVPIPGDWERKLHPSWPESKFTIPDPVPEGHIYYIRKGDYVRRGATALVERLPSGHIAKTPLPNPYNTEKERNNRQNMEHKYYVYCLISPSLFIPGLISWDSKSKILVLEDLAKGDLKTYFKNHSHTNPDTRQK